MFGSDTMYLFSITCPRFEIVVLTSAAEPCYLDGSGNFTDLHRDVNGLPVAEPRA